MKIGITSRCIIENNIKKEFVNEEYLFLLNRYHLTPIIIPYGVDNKDLIELCDGFLIPGGDDIDAKYYHQTNDSHNVLVPNEVDDLDFLVLKHAVEHKKPLLGICRGLQVINVFFGGDLIQHIEDDSHRNSTHKLIVNPNSFLFEKGNLKEVNSFHHQKIGTIGEGINVEATSNDAVEVITRSNRIIATQFHLEKNDDEISKLIMEHFLKMFSKKYTK